MAVLGLDEHKDAGRLLTCIDALKAEAGIREAVVVHHMGHTGERARGDSRLLDWPDVIWKLVRQDDDPASPRFFSAYGRDVDVQESQLAYDSLTRRLTIAGGSRRDAGHRDALEAILTVVRDAPTPMSGRTIIAALEDSGHPRAAVRAALGLGTREGALVVTEGARRARLYHVGAVVGQCAAVRHECASAPASECAAAHIERRTRALHDGIETTDDPGALNEGGPDADYRA